jgi:hypothetical protein
MARFLTEPSKLDEHLNLQYDYIYISIGSKFNHKYVNTAISRTNAPEQMLPKFLHGRPSKQILSVVIDVFPDMDSLQQNISLINDVLSDNIKCVLINKLCNQSFITSLIEKLTDYFQSYQIPPENCMICNYVRHMNEQNNSERESEDIIPSTIQESLQRCNDGKYDGCFYQWFGYRTHFYNYIYNYKNMRIFEFIPAHMNTVEDILIQSKSIYLNMSTVVQHKSVIHIFKNIINITTSNYGADDICICSFQELSENNKVAFVL